MLPQEEGLTAIGALQWKNELPRPHSSYSPIQLPSVKQVAFAASNSEKLLLFPFLSQYFCTVSEYTSSNNKNEWHLTQKSWQTCQ